MIAAVKSLYECINVQHRDCYLTFSYTNCGNKVAFRILDNKSVFRRVWAGDHAVNLLLTS